MAPNVSDSPSLPPSEGLGGPVAASGGEDGPFPVPSSHAGAEGFLGAPGLAMAEDTPSFGWFCPVTPGCPSGGVGRYLTQEAASYASSRHVAEVHGYAPIPPFGAVMSDGPPDAPSTPPAAPVPAAQCPEVAGEPESGQGGTAGREAALDRTRRYLVPVARLDLPDQPDDTHLSVYEWVPKIGEWVTGLALCGYSTEQGALADGTKVTCASCLEYQPKYQFRFDSIGCNAECRMTGTHSLRPGGCEHATPSEPTVSLSRVYTDPGDGHRFISFSRYTPADLAEIIEPALHDVDIRLGPDTLAMLGRGEEVRLSAGEIGRLALAAADAIVTHSNKDET